MTAGGQPPRGSIAETVQTTDGFLRHAGRDFLVVLYTAVRSLKLYPIENAQVQKALDDLTATTKHLLDVEKEIELRMQGEFIFVNSTRLRLDLDNYASFSHILGVLRQSGIGAVRIDEGVERNRRPEGVENRHRQREEGADGSSQQQACQACGHDER